MHSPDIVSHNEWLQRREALLAWTAANNRWASCLGAGKAITDSLNGVINAGLSRVKSRRA